MEIIYQPFVHPEFEFLIERIHPPRVCIDNDTCQDSTLVKVDSVNRHGILLEMVQVLTDLDLVISKSYISSDGGWFMDVFHVTDQLGNKLTDEILMLYIQQALCPSRRGGISKEIQRSLKRDVRPRHVSTKNTALEMTGTDRPGLLSEISAVLFGLGCHVTAAVAWTHNTRVACIIYVEDGFKGGPITDPKLLAHVEEELENVVEAHHENGERRSVRMTAPAAGRTHTERRLHQLMYADRDYEQCHGCDCSRGHWKGCVRTHVSIESCKEKKYLVVHVKSRDRPKLLFDTVCALTDMQYVVFHAAVSSKGLIANQGLKLELCTKNIMGLLSRITRVFRENGLSISRAEIGTHGEKVIGSFYVTDMIGHDVNLNTLELVIREIGGSALVVSKSTGWSSQASSSSISRTSSGEEENRPRFSLGGMLWSQLERLSSNFGSIRS